MLQIYTVELVKKLKDFQTNAKNSLERKKAKEILDKLETIRIKEDSKKAKEENKLETLSNLDEQAKRIDKILKTTEIPQVFHQFLVHKRISQPLVELLYFCTVNQLYTPEDAQIILTCFGTMDFDNTSKLKIIQMLFYFTKLEVSDETCFKMLDLVINTFAGESLELDSVTRPVVCEIISKILNRDVKIGEILSNNEISNELIDIGSKEIGEIGIKEINNHVIEIDSSGMSNMDNDKISEISELKVFNCENEIIHCSNNNLIENETINDENLILLNDKTNNPLNNAINNTANNTVSDKANNTIYDVSINSSIKSPVNTVKPTVNNINVLTSFIYSSIIHKKRFFSLYILNSFFKYNSICNSKEFINFIENQFSEISSEILRNGRPDDISSLFEILLELNKIMGHSPLLKIYDTFDQSMQSVYALQFLNFFKNFLTCMNTPIPEIILEKMRIAMQFLGVRPETLLIYKKILFVLQPKFNANEFVSILFERISKETTENTELESLFYNCLEYCVNFDIRDLFEKGITLGYSGTVKRSVKAVKIFQKYMKTSWKVYFENAVVFSFENLKNFELEDLKFFIAEIKNPNEIALAIFEGAENHFKYENTGNNTEMRIEIFKNLLIKVTNTKILLDLILRFYLINSTSEGIEMPIEILIEHLKTTGEEEIIENSISIVYFFINELVMSISLKNCWSSVFNLISFIPDPSGQKSQLLLQIQEGFIHEFSASQLEHFFKVFKFLFSTVVNYQCILNSVFIYGELIDFLIKKFPIEENKANSIWKDSIQFGCEMLESDWAISKESLAVQSVLKHLFRAYKTALEVMGNEEIEDFNDILIKITTIVIESNIRTNELINKENIGNLNVSHNNKTLSILLMEWKQILSLVELNKNTVILLDYLGVLVIEKDEEISLKAFESIEIILSKSNSEFFKILGVDELMKKIFEKILLSCNPEKKQVFSNLFLQIPLLLYSFDEIKKLSEEFVVFVCMAEPFRSNAVDCFIKVCGHSGQFSFCLKVLSSWLSNDQKDVSLSLIEKISEKLESSSDFLEKDSKLTGLSNFLEYSKQFSSSEDFLVPVLDLICRCGCTIDGSMAVKLMEFSRTFLEKQMQVKYSKIRESSMVKYLEFLKVINSNSPVNESSIEIFGNLLNFIVSSKTPYLNVKLCSYSILFSFYSLYNSYLEIAINTLFDEFVYKYLRSGSSVPTFYIKEVYFILEQIEMSQNVNLINQIKLKMIDLLIVNDFEILNSVREILKYLFSIKTE